MTIADKLNAALKHAPCTCGATTKIVAARDITNHADDCVRGALLEASRVFDYASDLGDRPIHAWFSLSYASWLTLPRLSLQEMPAHWQARLVNLLHEGESQYGLTCPEGIIVTRRNDQGRFAPLAHWNNYRRGTVEEACLNDG